MLFRPIGEILKVDFGFYCRLKNAKSCNEIKRVLDLSQRSAKWLEFPNLIEEMTIDKINQVSTAEITEASGIWSQEGCHPAIVRT